jgi:hypothetical protein
VFSTAEMLKDKLMKTLFTFDKNTTTEVLQKWKNNLKDFGKEDWDTQWQKVMIGKVIRNNKAY